MNIGYFYKEGLVQALHLTSNHLFSPSFKSKHRLQTQDADVGPCVPHLAVWPWEVAMPQFPQL